MRSISRNIKSALRKFPKLNIDDGYIYFVDFDHIVAGFLFERGSGGYYVWDFALPLFDGMDVRHLTFGTRLEGRDGFLSDDRIASSSETTELISDIIFRYSPKVADLMNVESFMARIHPNLFDGNLHSIFAYACSLSMVGNDYAAMKVIQKLKASIHFDLYEKVKYNALSLERAINEGGDAAFRLLSSWEEIAKKSWCSADRTGLP